MTNDELVEALDDFGGFLNVIAMRETDTEQYFYEITGVDYGTVAGDGRIILEVKKFDPYSS